MELITNNSGYNYWRGTNKKGAYYYNVVPEKQSQPKGGYMNSDYICKVKGVPNMFPSEIN